MNTQTDNTSSTPLANPEALTQDQNAIGGPAQTAVHFNAEALRCAVADAYRRMAPHSMYCLEAMCGTLLFPRHEQDPVSRPVDRDCEAESEESLRLAVAAAEGTFGPGHVEVGRRLCLLAQFLDREGRLEEAEAVYRRAIPILEACLAERDPETAAALLNLGLILRDEGQLVEAAEATRRSVAFLEESLGKDHPTVATAKNNLANLLHDMGRLRPDAALLREAKELYEEALGAWQLTLGPGHPYVGWGLNNLAMLAHDEGNDDEAIRLMQRAFKVLLRASFMSRLSKDSPWAVSLCNLCSLFAHTGRELEALQAAVDEVVSEVFGSQEAPQPESSGQ